MPVARALKSRKLFVRMAPMGWLELQVPAWRGEGSEVDVLFESWWRGALRTVWLLVGRYWMFVESAYHSSA